MIQATYRTPKGADKTIGLRPDQQEDFEVQQRRRSERQDTHGK